MGIISKSFREWLWGIEAYGWAPSAAAALGPQQASRQPPCSFPQNHELQMVTSNTTSFSSGLTAVDCLSFSS